MLEDQFNVMYCTVSIVSNVYINTSMIEEEELTLRHSDDKFPLAKVRRIVAL